jgi:hypothetical protein
MKKIILVLVASVCSFQLWSQGTLELTTGAAINTTGGAYFVLDNMHIKNNGSFQQTSGNGMVKLTGGLDVNLSGNSPTTINELLMAKSGNAFNLLSNLVIVSDVNFSGGILNLNNNKLDLGTTGLFLSESEISRAFTTGTGYIEATGSLNNPSVANPGNLGAVITSSTNLGNTIIRRGHKVQTGISGSNNSILRYYDIIPANNTALKATLRFKYFDAELNSLPEATLNHWQSPNLINWNLMGADTRDGIANYVERKTYGKFDRITLATATAPGISCPASQTVSANMNGCKASVLFTATATGIPAPSITYKIGNTVIASPYLFPKGTTTVTATAANGIVLNASCTFTVTVVCGPIASSARFGEVQQETFAELSVSARPNPSAHYFTLDIKSNEQHPVTIRIIDVMGRIISTQPNVSSNTLLNVGHKYRPGIYFVQAIQGKQIVTLKLVKQAY